MSGQRLSIGVHGGAADVLALADAAEGEGVDAIWVGEPGTAHDAGGDSYRTMIAAAVAARTRFIRIGCALTFGDPDSTLRLSEDVAMIDQAAAGRLELLLVLADPACEERAGRLLSAWRGWETSDGRRLPVTPRPMQPSLPRLVAAREFDDPSAARLGAGVLAGCDDLPARGQARTRVERRVIAFDVASAHELLADGSIPAVARMREIANQWEADEVAIWLHVGEHAVADEVRLLSRIVAPGLAGGDTQWEMLAELGARAAGFGPA
ncbi:MAG TPA: LLM class flavin-dependent oxidoreductase [Candidatus Dormibacteraeota bacterium]